MGRKRTIGATRVLSERLGREGVVARAVLLERLSLGQERCGFLDPSSCFLVLRGMYEGALARADRADWADDLADAVAQLVEERGRGGLVEE